MRVTDLLNGGAGNSVSTYPAFVSSNCANLCAANFVTASDPASTRLRASLSSAASAGGFAAFFYAAAILALVAQTVSSIWFACASGGKAQKPSCCSHPLPACCDSAAGGIVLACAAFFPLVAATAIGWGVYSGVAAAGLSYLGSGLSNALWDTAQWYGGAGAGVSGVALLFGLISLILEISRVTCCRGGGSPALSPSGEGGGATTVIVHNPVSAAGPAYAASAPAVAVGNPYATPQPHVYAMAPPATAPPAPAALSQKPLGPKPGHAHPGPPYYAAPPPGPPLLAAPVALLPPQFGAVPPPPPAFAQAHFAPPAYHAPPPGVVFAPPAHHAPPPPGIVVIGAPFPSQEQEEAQAPSGGLGGFEKVRRAGAWDTPTTQPPPLTPQPPPSLKGTFESRGEARHWQR